MNYTFEELELIAEALSGAESQLGLRLYGAAQKEKPVIRLKMKAVADLADKVVKDQSSKGEA